VTFHALNYSRASSIIQPILTALQMTTSYCLL